MCFRFLQVGLRFLLKLHVFSCDEGCIGQGQPAPTTQSNATRQRGELVVDDVVVLEVLLKLIDIINLHHQTQTFADEHEEGVDQRLGGFAADISFLSFVVLLHLLIRQALDLVVCELNANGLFGLASRNKDGQLLAFGGNVVARCETCQPLRIRCGLSFQNLHDFVQSVLLGGHHVYNVFQISMIFFTSGSRASISRITPAMVSDTEFKRKG